MNLLQAVADHSIRRALGFVGLAVGMVLLSLSFDAVLALRASADLLGVVCAVMLFLAWRAPRQNMRHTEMWTLLQDNAPEFVRSLRQKDAQDVVSRVMRERLVWHAERIGAVALAFWVLSALVALVR